MRAPETPRGHLIVFLFRSKWNLVGLLVGVGCAYVILKFVEPVQLKLVLAFFTFVLSFFGFMAIGIRREYREENKDAEAEVQSSTPQRE